MHTYFLLFEHKRDINDRSSLILYAADAMDAVRTANKSFSKDTWILIRINRVE